MTFPLRTTCGTKLANEHRLALFMHTTFQFGDEGFVGQLVLSKPACDCMGVEMDR